MEAHWLSTASQSAGDGFPHCFLKFRKKMSDSEGDSQDISQLGRDLKLVHLVGCNGCNSSLRFMVSGSIPVRAPGVDLQAVSSDQAMSWAEFCKGKMTSWKINGWNLQITQFGKEHDLQNLHDYVPC